MPSVAEYHPDYYDAITFGSGAYFRVSLSYPDNPNDLPSWEIWTHDSPYSCDPASDNVYIIAKHAVDNPTDCRAYRGCVREAIAIGRKNKLPVVVQSSEDPGLGEVLYLPRGWKPSPCPE